MDFAEFCCGGLIVFRWLLILVVFQCLRAGTFISLVWLLRVMFACCFRLCVCDWWLLVLPCCGVVWLGCLLGLVWSVNCLVGVVCWLGFGLRGCYLFVG